MLRQNNPGSIVITFETVELVEDWEKYFFVVAGDTENSLQCPAIDRYKFRQFV